MTVPLGLMAASSIALNLQITLGTTQVQWNNVYFYIETNVLTAGDNIEIQSQLSGGNWTSLVSDLNHSVTSQEIANYTLNLSGAPTAGSIDSRARITHNGVTTPWSNTITYNVPARPFVTAPVLSAQGLDSLGGEILRASIDNTVVAGDIVTWQVQTAGGNWSTIKQTLAYSIVAQDITNGYVSFTTYFNGSCDVRAKATHQSSDSNWSNTGTYSLTSAPVPTYVDIAHWYTGQGSGGVVTYPLNQLGNPAYLPSRRVFAYCNVYNGPMSSASIAGIACDHITEIAINNGQYYASIISALVPAGATGVIALNIPAGGSPDVGIYTVDDTLLNSPIPVMAGSHKSVTPGNNNSSASVATLAKGFMLIGTWFASNNVDQNVTSSAGTPVVDVQTDGSYVGAHMTNLANNASNTITVTGNATQTTDFNMMIGAIR